MNASKSLDIWSSAQQGQIVTLALQLNATAMRSRPRNNS